MSEVLNNFLLISIITTHVLCFQCDPPCSTCLFSAITTCVSCIDGYYIEQNKCLKCSTGCLQCSNSSSCFKCADRYFIQDSLCNQCMDGCIKCLKPSQCQVCQLEYYINLDSNTCSQCSDNCANCTSNVSCSICLTGFYQANGLCLQCSSNCLQCKNNSFCTTCKDNHYLQKNNDTSRSCSICPSPCSNCKIEQSCLKCDGIRICDSKCISKYLLNKNSCQSGIVSYVLVFQIMIPAVFCACLLLSAIIRYRKKRQLVRSSVQQTGSGEVTLRQISQVFSLVWLRHKGKNLDFVSECTICQEKGVNVCTSCKHMFHLHCLLLWTEKNGNCPNCRNEEMQNVRIYCRLCHRNYVSKELKYGSIIERSSSFNHCDFCKTI